MRSASSFQDYLSQHPKWHEGILKLQKTILETGLKETIKWGAPVYTYNDKNLVSIGAFKNHLSLWYYNGSLLTDKAKLLLKVQDKTKHMRHLRYHSNDEIDLNIVQAYTLETINHIKENKIPKTVKIKKPLVIPDELLEALEHNPSLKDAFNELSLSKRREYAEYIATAKQDKTKLSRLEKISPMIQNGQGLNDKYR